MVEVDPIRCWWRTSSAAVRMGETFTVGLTCAVLETDGVQVIPDESQLTDSAVQLNPFEVIGGSHPPDLRSGQRRFFQYDYVTRVINPDVIGQDVPLPNLVVHYRVNSRLPGNAAHAGTRPELPAAAADDPRPVARAVGCHRYPRRVGRELRPGRVARRPRGRVRDCRGHVRRARRR